MTVLDFTHKKFCDIPDQDNPAFDAIECFLVCRCADYSDENKKFMVVKINPVDNPIKNASVTRIATFWDSKMALDFTDAYVKYLKG